MRPLYLVASLLAVASVSMAGKCIPIVDDCDAHFTSMATQTWAEQTIAPHTIQIITYFANFHACLEDTPSGLALSESACGRPSSRYSVVDNATFSIAKNQESSKCITAKFGAPEPVDLPCGTCIATCVAAIKTIGSGNATECPKICQESLKCKNGTNSTATKSFKLKYEECCRPHGCSPAQAQSQMWLQPITSSDPYNIVKNEFNGSKYCLTRVNGTTDVIATECDPLWASRSTQTFAHINAGYPYVQLSAYWASEHACVGANSSDGTVTLSEEACKGPSSIFAFSDLSEYGYYKNQATGKCLAADFEIAPPIECQQCIKVCNSSSTNGTDKCQSFCDGQGCVSAKPTVSLVSEECNEQNDEQLWSQLGATKDLYKRIQVKHTDIKDTTWCLTRSGESTTACSD
jgi:hypothetical protein